MLLLKKIYIMLRQKKIEDKTPDSTNLATNTTLNAKINKIKRELTSNTILARTAALLWK